MKRFLASSLLVFMTATAVDAAKPETRNRAEIGPQYKWDVSQIFSDWDAWEVGLKQMQEKMDQYAALKGSLARGPEALLGAYRLFDEIGQLQYRVYCYAMLQRDVDLRDNAVNARLQRVQSALARFGTATAWFAPELLSIPQATTEKWIAETPALAPYRFPIMEAYRQARHVLDEKGERLLSFSSQLSQVPGAAFQELSTSDIKFPQIKLTDGREMRLSPGTYQQILNTEPLQADRAKAWAEYYKTYEATINTYAAIYNGVLQRDWFTTQARNYASTLEAALHGNAIPPAVVETLVSATRAGTAPLQRYLRLRKKLLGLETYHLYDNFVPIFQVNKTVSYEDAKQVVITSAEPLGGDYMKKYRAFFESGRIDVFENDGKRSGAYSMGVYGVGPYLLLNHTDTLDDAFTLAHEGGHAMHTVLSFETQPFSTADYTIFVAEVASTTNERFLLNELLGRTTDPRERFVLLQHAVDSIVSTYYTQVLFADFELQAHRLVERGEPVTADVLNGIYLKLLQDYYGDAATIDDLYKITWSRIPHFFNSPYYVFQYATCFASSAQLVKAMTTGDAASRKAATDRYLTLLRSGGNDHPMEQLRKAGVDLSRRETIQAVIDQMDELVGQLEAEAARIK
jgi:oligoendopeptidase F